jgi:hypothetical protein
MVQQIIEATVAALLAVEHPRFFRTERGYQGRFYCFLQGQLEARGFLRGDDIIEMEYQKSARHGFYRRPDIIFHVPAEVSGAPVTENNFAVWAFKANAKSEGAKEDFDKLEEMFEHLHYPLGSFVNIGTEHHHLGEYNGTHAERMHGYAVSLQNGKVSIRHAYYIDGSLREDVIQK